MGCGSSKAKQTMKKAGDKTKGPPKKKNIEDPYEVSEHSDNE